MNTKEAVKSLQEYVNVPLAELVESSTNPRKTFDVERLEELAESIRSKGVLSPLLARKVNGHFEIVFGAMRYRAAQRAGLQEVPVRIAALTDSEALETQIVENLLRSDVHPFEEAQGFRALLEREGAGYTIEKIAAKTGKKAPYIAKQLRLLDLIPPVADAFTAGHIGTEHALLIAKLGAEAQEKAFVHCFDGYYAANDSERSLVPVSRLRAWIAQNIYLSLKSIPFSKDDETLVPEAGSCANCPKRTGFNRLLFSEVREDSDSCADAACFNRKLDAHIAQRVAKVPNLVMISDNCNTTGETPILARRNYIEVVTRKSKKGRGARPEEKLCGHLTPAIHADGIDKGRLVKVCRDTTCKVHFGERQEQERQRLQWKTEKKAANRKANQTLAFRHRVLADVLKRVKPQLGTEELRMVAQFVLRSLSHELVCRLAKRHGLQNPKDAHDWQMAEKARALYKKADAHGLAVLIFEVMLIGFAGSATENKDDDLLTEAACLYKVDTKAVRSAVAKAEKEKTRTKAEGTRAKVKPASETKVARK
jgi:ParB family transcriptional regulator, chromosome partitioning protein